MSFWTLGPVNRKKRVNVVDLIEVINAYPLKGKGGIIDLTWVKGDTDEVIQGLEIGKQKGKEIILSLLREIALDRKIDK